MIRFYKTFNFTIPAVAGDAQPVDLVPNFGNFFGMLAPEFFIEGNSDLLEGIGLESNAFLQSYRVTFQGAIGLRPSSAAMVNGRNQIEVLTAGKAPGQIPIFWLDSEYHDLMLSLITDPYSTSDTHAPQVSYNPPTDPIVLYLDTRNIQPLYLGQSATCVLELVFTNQSIV